MAEHAVTGKALGRLAIAAFALTAAGTRAFCRAQGYRRAPQREFARPGRTWVLGSNRACEGDFCIGFSYVVCADPGR